MTKVNTALKH